MNRIEKIAIAMALVFVLSPFFSRGYSVFAGNKVVKLGIIVQKQFERNYEKIDRLKKDIHRLETENQWMLRKVLQANGIVLKDKETCSLDANTWTLKFNK